MSENQTRILEMLRDKKITVEEAERLLSLIGPGGNSGDTRPPGAENVKKPAAKYLRVMVTPDPEGSPDGENQRVNIRVPVSLIRAGMKFTSLMPQHAADEVQNAMRERGMKFDLRTFKDSDIEELVNALNELEVDVDDRRGKRKVRVYTE